MREDFMQILIIFTIMVFLGSLNIVLSLIRGVLAFIDEEVAFGVIMMVLMTMGLLFLMIFLHAIVPELSQQMNKYNVNI